ncbi:MAG: hypothetical protein OXB98_23090 [Bryobacterales bacterium]|nr:hypothetical protein [Bryobacterales bacterium]
MQVRPNKVSSMLPAFLIPETTIDSNGSTDPIDLGESAGNRVLLTLGILDIVEQESLDIAIWGSEDGEEWGEKPIRAFPQKFYAGTYQILCPLDTSPEVRYLRVEWKVHRWGVGETTPMFKFYLFAELFAAYAPQKTA